MIFLGMAWYVICEDEIGNDDSSNDGAENRGWTGHQTPFSVDHFSDVNSESEI